jgi:ATP-dependent Clp protease ATP-binding subunit ClpC
MYASLEYPLTERVEEALRKAQAAARQLGHEYVGTEHILLGVIADPSAEIPSLLRAHGVEPDTIPALVTLTVRRGKAEETQPRIRPYGSRAQHVLRAAAAEAAALNHGAVDIDHLLLALRQDDRAIAGQIMADAGIEPGWIRDHVARRRGAQPPPEH